MLDIKDLSLSLDGQLTLDRVSMALEKNKIGVLLGPSGSGKTTLLQCIAGFQQPDKGQITIAGRIVNDPVIRVTAVGRKLGMMFQDYALFPHLNTEENIRFGIHHIPSVQRRNIVNHLLELTSMTAYARHYPHELSGGQQQRVALARALAPDPKLLLLDEPFSGMDADLKLQLISDMKDILMQKKITTLMVTHDQGEALSISDMLGVMRNGRILQWDSSYNIYHRPVSVDIATFVGMGRMIRGRIDADNMVHTVLGDFPVNKKSVMPGLKEVAVLVRPDDIIHDDNSVMRAVIEKKQFRGADFLYHLRLENGEKIYCFAPSHHVHHIGEAVGIKTDIEHVIIFPSQSIAQKDSPVIPDRP